MDEENPFGDLERRLQALSVTLAAEASALAQRGQAWSNEEACLRRHASELRSWLHDLRTYPLPARIVEAERATTRFERWARAVRRLHWRILALRLACACLAMRVAVRTTRRRAAAHLRDESFLVVIGLLGALLLLVAILTS